MTAAAVRWWLPAAVAAVAGTVLVLTSLHDAGDLVRRLAPVLLFVAAMSVVVNLAADAGAFGAVADGLRRITWRRLSAPAATWLQVVVLATISTVFLSLDTTAIMVTPLAVALARRSGSSLWAIGLTVVWIANVGSLLLPVSNLTNLLAVSGGVFSGTADYASVMWGPAVIALAVVLVASWGVHRWTARSAAVASVDFPAGPATAAADPRLRISLVVLGCLVPLLVSPIPFWLSSTVAAAILVGVSLRMAPRAVALNLVPWWSLLFVVALSTAAAALASVGATEWIANAVGSGEQSSGGLVLLGGAGAVLANAMNNIPAFLALDAGITGHQGMAALLVGVNAGPIITPWASLATLLWHDQLRRNGVDVPWRRFIVAGCVLAPVAVGLPLLAV